MNAEFIYDHHKLLITEKATMEKPNEFKDWHNKDIWFGEKKDSLCRDFEDHLVTRRSFHYELTEADHGKVLLEGIDFEVKLTRIPPTYTVPWAKDRFEYVAVPIVKDEEETFEDYMSNAREKFVIDIHNQKWNNAMRTAAEDLLICFDQMRERLTTH
jgi:hypothetical protein